MPVIVRMYKADNDTLYDEFRATNHDQLTGLVKTALASELYASLEAQATCGECGHVRLLFVLPELDLVRDQLEQ